MRKAIDLFIEGGWSAIKPAARGRSAGDGRLLSIEQEAAVRRTICDKRPEQLKMEFALWTRGAVMQYIEREFGVRLSVGPPASTCAAGVHAAEADQAGLRTAARSGQAVDRPGVPGHRAARQGRGRRDPLGR